MKYLKYYKLFESKIDKILYHGSPYKFKTFKKGTSYFTDDINFASDYSEQKSMDYGMDNGVNIYKVKVNTNLFDINNKNDYNKLSTILPEKVNYIYNDFGFSAAVPKYEILFNMKGLDKIEPLEAVIKGDINDTFPNPEYDIESYIILFKDTEYAYSILTITYDNYINLPLNRVYSHKGLGIERINSIFKESVDYVKNYIDNNTEGYVRDYVKRDYLEKFKDNKGYYFTEDIDIPDKNLTEFNKIYESNVTSLRKYLKDNDRLSKFTLVEKIVKLKNTWRFFENDTIHNALIKLNYGGYVALERGINTYAIFRPDKDVEILNIT